MSDVGKPPHAISILILDISVHRLMKAQGVGVFPLGSLLLQLQLFPWLLTRPLLWGHFISCPSGVCKLCTPFLAALHVLQPESND